MVGARTLGMAVLVVGLALGCAGCTWSWPSSDADHGDGTAPPPETLGQAPDPPVPSEVTGAGVGVVFEGPPPEPATREGCVARWNDGNGRDALASLPGPGSPSGNALVEIGASPSGDALDERNRCTVWVYVATDGQRARANYVVELAPGRFGWAGGVSYIGEEPNASLSADGRLALR
jgi:hypothetical protein